LFPQLRPEEGLTEVGDEPEADEAATDPGAATT